MSDDPTATLITGPNRGIGRGILSALLARPNNVVIAGVRNPEAPVSQGLKELFKGEGSSLHIVKIDNGVHSDPAAAIKDIEAAGLSYIDTVVANAATGDTAESVLNTPLEEVSRHLDINTIGVLALFQATEPLLRKNKSGNPKFVALSSNLGSTALAPYVQGPWYCYGVTKAALNYTIRRIFVDNDWLTATSLQPGWVQTDMGQYAAKCVGMESAPMKLEDSDAGCVKVIDSASKEKYNGEFVDSELNQVLW